MENNENLKKEELNNEDTEKVTEESVVDEVENEKVDNTAEVETTEEAETTEATDELPPMEVIAEVETTYDYRTLKYCNMYILKVKRKSTLIYSIMAAVCLIVAIVSFIRMEGNGKWLSLIIAFLGLWTFKNIFTEEAKVDKSLQNFFRTNAPFTQRFAFDRERIRVTAMVDGEEKQADYPWPYIQEIHMIPEFFILFLNGGTPVIIDRDESKLLKGTKEELEQIIREQSALKPFKSYDKPFVKKMIDITYYATLNQEESIVEEKPEVAEESNEITEDNKDNK